MEAFFYMRTGAEMNLLLPELPPFGCQMMLKTKYGSNC